MSPARPTRVSLVASPATLASLVALVAALVALVALDPSPANAEIVHKYEPNLSGKYAQSVPADTQLGALTFDSGHLWAEELNLNTVATRVGEYQATTAAEVKPPLVPEEGLTAFDNTPASVAVGHAPAPTEEKLYVSAAEAEKGVVGVYGGSSGKWLATWSGAHTPNGSFTEAEGKSRAAEITGVAADDTPEPSLDSARGDLYVATASGREFRQPPPFPALDAVDVFAPVAGGGEPASVVTRLTGTCENKEEMATGPKPCEGSPSKAVVPFAEPSRVAVSGLNGDVLVADQASESCREGGPAASGCVLDVFAPEAEPGKYRFMFQITETQEGRLLGRIAAIAVDGSDGDVYVVEQNVREQQGPPRPGVVDEFSASGVFLGRITGTPEGPFGEQLASVTVDPEATSNDVFLGEALRPTGRIDVFGPNVIVPDVKVGEVEEITPGSGKLTGTVNLAGGGPATCVFEYGVGGYEHTVGCEPHEVVGEEEAVSARVSGLSPDTVYRFRVAATNANGTNNGEGIKADEGVFQTTGPGFHGSASGVSTDAATLQARVQPDGAPTSFYFEYGAHSVSEHRAPAAPEPVGAGKTEVTVPVPIAGLSSATEYHYRLVLLSEVTPGQIEDFYGSEATFTTQGSSTSIGLPDGRQYQLVSPPDKHGSLILPIGAGRVTQASRDGRAVTYTGETPTEPEPAGYANVVQVLSTRGAGGSAGASSSAGWGSEDLATPHSVPVGFGNGSQEYRFFSEDLSLAVVDPFGAFFGLSPHASEQTPYERADFPAAQPEDLNSSASASLYTPLVSGCPQESTPCPGAISEFADTLPGTTFGLASGRSCPPERECGPSFVGASGDGRHVMIASDVALTRAAVGSASGQLYEWSATQAPAGRLTLASILPPTPAEEKNHEDGKPPAAGAELGSGVIRDAVSTDGSRVIWRVPNGHLYLRDVAIGQTVQLDAIHEGEGEGKVEPVFQAASADGSRVFFTDKQKLTADAGGEGERSEEGDLYECEVVVSAGGKLECKLTDLTPVSASGEHARVQGDVIGTSTDGSYVYFVADGVLENEVEGKRVPVAGALPGSCDLLASEEALCNLYVWHDGVVGLVARLSMEDAPDWNGRASVGQLEFTAAGSSPDGRWLAFMSDRSLTGYDMRDARLDVADEEVFSYHAPADLATEPGATSCVSCDPSGARPVGREFGQMTPGADGSEGLWAAPRVLAASLPGWVSYDDFNGSALHQPRFVSDNGRVFFNANDALVSADVNATGDVYEWEPGGVPSGAHACSTSSTTASDVYKPAHTVEVEGRTVVEGAGCVALISSGTSSDESIFLDASATGGRSEEDGEGVEGGGDVFFFTTSKLVKEDTDDSRDVYDAHECTSESPCLPEAAETPAPCESADACKPAPSPQPSIFGAGPTETFKGPGNIAPPPAGKPKVETRAEKLKAALASCKHKYPHSKKKRSTCEKKARKAYAAKHAAKKSSRKKH